jgi:hypothetical protein
MSLEDKKRRMLEARGKFYVEPNGLGGCAHHVLMREPLRYRLVLDIRYTPCDSISSWTEWSGGVETKRQHEWSATGDTQTPWFTVQAGYEIKDDCWSLLGQPNSKAMVRNFLSSMHGASKGGFKHVPAEVMEVRLTRCRACDYWDENARFGFGKCKHPECGCTKAKLWLARERCPQGFWESEPETENQPT